MSTNLRTYAIDRLQELGEFDADVMDSSTMQYERTQAMKDGLPSSFVARRRDEIQTSRWKYWTVIGLGTFGAIYVPLLLFFIGAGGDLAVLVDVPSWYLASAALFGLAVGVSIGVHRTREFINYHRRAELYDLIAWIDQDAAADSADTMGSSTTDSRVPATGMPATA